jgi:hypothetical protein
MVDIEKFKENHLHLLDNELLQVQDPPFTSLCMFVCTYEAHLSNLKINHEKLFELLTKKNDNWGNVVALNYNFGHAAKNGYEHYIKHPRVIDGNYSIAPPGRRQRKLQGDGTCFNNTIESVIIPTQTGEKTNKVYNIKCFPTTGETQVPGVIMDSLEDGKVVVQHWVNYLNTALTISPLITIEREGPIMLNFKFRLIRASPRIILNLDAIASLLENVIDGKIDSPYNVREIKPPTEDLKLSVKFIVVCENRPYKKVRVNIFLRGKINILGANSFEVAHKIYDFLSHILKTKWSLLVFLQPLPDTALSLFRQTPEFALMVNATFLRLQNFGLNEKSSADEKYNKKDTL